MFTRGGGLMRRLSSSAEAFQSAKFLAWTINGTASRGISTYACNRFTEEWSSPAKQEVAKNLTLSTIVPTVHFSRQSPELPPPLPSGKVIHPSVKFVQASTYGKFCAVDKIFAVCPEHLMLMRTAIGIARNPAPKPFEASCIIACELGKELNELSPNVLASMFEIGSSIKESRSNDMLENQKQMVRILNEPDKVPPQQLLRILEVVLSPLGMLANTYGSPNCKITKAMAEGRDVEGLMRFMDTLIMPSLSNYHVPYIKAPGSPFAHLQMQQYAHGAEVSNEELVTINHYLECCETKGGDIPDIPRLRSVVVNDPTGRTLQLHDRMNLPHFFDVSGTTGAVMQAALGLLHKAGKSNLVGSPQETIALGMLVAGCNFYKQGYHNYYEVLPALHWVNHHVWKQPYVQLTPTELLHAVPDSLNQCVDPSSEIAETVTDALDLVTEHFELHHDLAIEHIQSLASQEQQQTSGFTISPDDK